MTNKVFISYRREDAAAYAGRLHDRLRNDFEVFMDVDNIPLGRDFRTVLGEAVGNCDALIVCLGRGWSDAMDESGNRRLDSERDFVRYEIAAALERDIPVIPVLLDGAEMPTEQKLPDDVKPLAFRNGIEVRHVSFHADIDKLIRGLKLSTGKTLPEPLETNGNASETDQHTTISTPKEITNGGEGGRISANALDSGSSGPEPGQLQHSESKTSGGKKLDVVEHALLMLAGFLVSSFVCGITVAALQSSRIDENVGTAPLLIAWLMGWGAAYFGLMSIVNKGRASK